MFHKKHREIDWQNRWRKICLLAAAIPVILDLTENRWRTIWVAVFCWLYLKIAGKLKNQQTKKPDL